MLSVITIHLLHLSLNQSDFEAFLCSSCRRSSYTSIFIYTYIHRPLDFIHLTSILLKLVHNFFFFFFQVSMWISSIRSCPGHHQLVRISSLLSPPPDDSILNTLVPGGEDVYPSVIVHSPSRSIGDLSKGSLPPNQKAGEARHFDRFKKSIKSLVLSRQAFQKLSYVCTYLEESRPPHPCLPLMCFDGGGEFRPKNHRSHGSLFLLAHQKHPISNFTNLTKQEPNHSTSPFAFLRAR